jgi:hypothetical protein
MNSTNLLYFLSCFLVIITRFTVEGTFLEPPSPETIKIYKQEREKILNFYRKNFSRQEKPAFVKSCPEIENSLKILSKLCINDFLGLMRRESSKEFIVIFWQNFEKCNEGILTFGNLKSLHPSNSQTDWKLLKWTFFNFRNCLNAAVLKSKFPNWKKLKDSSASFENLQIHLDFWNAKLKPLAKEILKRGHFKKVERIVERRFTFLGVFLAHRTEDLLRWEYPNLIEDIQGGVVRITFIIQDFCFLARHFRAVLTYAESKVFTLKLEWLSSQPAQFIALFLYFAGLYWLDNYPWERQFLFRTDRFKKSNRDDIVLQKDRVLIFDKPITKSNSYYNEIRRMAHIILKKINTVDFRIHYEYKKISSDLIMKWQ